MSDLERALNELEANLSAIWEQADAEYVARHFPWHVAGDVCTSLPAHTHTRRGRIMYWPKSITVDPPT